MAETEEWAERRRRMVKCKKHGLHYDPKMASGCTLCLKESTKAPPQRPPQVTIILLCVLGMAFAAYQIFGPSQLGEEEEPLLGPAPDMAQTAQAPLDPEPYRQNLEALERALFTEIRTDTDLAGTGISIENACRNLGAEIRRQAPQYAETEAVAIESLARGIADAFTYKDLEELKSDWLLIRRRAFSPASWFTTPAGSGSPAQRIAIGEYGALASNLQSLIEEGAAEAQSYADSADFPDRDQRWQDFRGNWQERLGALWQNKPARPGADADPRILLATQQLEQAFQNAWALANNTGYLRSETPATAFDPVLSQVQKAQQTLDEVGS